MDDLEFIAFGGPSDGAEGNGEDSAKPFLPALLVTQILSPFNIDRIDSTQTSMNRRALLLRGCNIPTLLRLYRHSFICTTRFSLSVNT